MRERGKEERKRPQVGAGSDQIFVESQTFRDREGVVERTREIETGSWCIRGGGRDGQVKIN